MDKQWLDGHRSGYLDAMAEIYEIIHRDDLRSDQFALLVSVSRDLRKRYKTVLADYETREIGSGDKG